MTWGSHCSNCGREDCGWAHGKWCQGAVEKMANALEAAEREIDECHEVQRIDRDEIAGLRGEAAAARTEVIERQDTPGAWSVEAIDHGSEGEVYLAVFSGPDAQGRAHEYARTKYRLDQTPAQREDEDA